MDASKLTASSLDKVASQGSVETFPLVHPSSTNNNRGVYVYLDEVGMLRRLPPNLRASGFARACGYSPAPSFYGDVFVGRVETKPAIRNVDFVVGEDTDLSAEWVKRAVRENVEWQQEVRESFISQADGYLTGLESTLWDTTRAGYSTLCLYVLYCRTSETTFLTL